MNPRLLRPRQFATVPRLPGLEGWWDAADTSTVTLNGTSVSGWADKSGKGRNATQDTAGLQPTWVAASNRIDTSSNQRLVLPSAVSLTGDFTVFSVIERTSGGRLVTLLENSSSLSNNTLGALAAYFDAWPGAGWTTALNTGANPNLTTSVFSGQSIVRLRRGGTNGVFAINNTSVTFTALTTAMSPDVIVGGTQNNVTRGQRHNEVIIYNRSLSDADVARVEQYLAAKWSLVLA
jgi:hypothetical protein